MTPSWLSGRVYVTHQFPGGFSSEGPRIAKCIVYRLGTYLADLLQERFPVFSASSPFMKELRHVGMMKYPPLTPHVTSNKEWDRCFASADKITLLPRNSRGDKDKPHPNQSKQSTEGLKYHVKDLFVNKPPAAIGRPSKPFPQSPAPKIPKKVVEEEQRTPVDKRLAFEKLVGLGKKQGNIDGRVVPSRMRRSGY